LPTRGLLKVFHAPRLAGFPAWRSNECFCCCGNYQRELLLELSLKHLSADSQIRSSRKRLKTFLPTGGSQICARGGKCGPGAAKRRTAAGGKLQSTEQVTGYMDEERRQREALLKLPRVLLASSLPL